MAHIPRSRLVHSVTVRPVIGQIGEGAPKYGEAFTVRCLVVERTKTVLGPDGADTTSSAQFACRLSDGDRINQGDQVTLPSGRVTKVVDTARGDDGNRGAWQHTQVSLQ